MTVYPVLP